MSLSWLVLLRTAYRTLALRSAIHDRRQLGDINIIAQFRILKISIIQVWCNSQCFCWVTLAKEKVKAFYEYYKLQFFDDLLFQQMVCNKHLGKLCNKETIMKYLSCLIPQRRIDQLSLILQRKNDSPMVINTVNKKTGLFNYLSTSNNTQLSRHSDRRTVIDFLLFNCIGDITRQEHF